MLQTIFAEEVRKFLKPAGEFVSVQTIFEAGAEKRVQAELQRKFTARVRELLKP